MKPVSIYIHWPFCLSLCPYCDFNSHIAGDVNDQQWIDAYKSEIDFFKHHIEKRYVKSVFFGGGTPSLMNPKIVEAIINYLSDLGTIDQSTEITLEANPTSYEADKFRSFKSAGINRVSIGVQSFDDNNLQFLGRKHSAKDALYAITSAAQIFDRYSYDLIYSLPNQTLSDWTSELKQGINFSNDHISLYQLTIEKGTPFYKLYSDKKFILPSDEVAADMYEWTNQYLQSKDYQRYEISNYAKPGSECLHNLVYWNYQEYIGIGPGAHSRIHTQNNISSIMTLHSPQKWLSSVQKTGNGIQKNIRLSDEDITLEYVMMASRLASGFLESDLQKVTGKTLDQVFNMSIIHDYQKLGLVDLSLGRFKLTSKGLVLHSYIISRIML
ncbi:MAG: hypothetical protein DGJ47_000798 [Rickettsiaceae bacterium]